tara:strand:- start:718 stop:2610 length:1893 start_codon:yes stop_codon:yes gene_type:complete
MKTINNFKEYLQEYQKSLDSPESFWEEKAKHFVWKKKWEKVLDWNFETAKIKWFDGACLNITENCLDRHLSENGNNIAIKWISNNINEPSKNITYNKLHKEVCKFANVLKKYGVKKGDRICLYMPMIPELTISMLACARIGAIHSVVFAGFSAKSLSDRINDAKCSIIVTADGSFRGKKIIPLKEIADQATKITPSIKKCVVVKRVQNKINFNNEKDVWWHKEMKDISSDCNARSMAAEDTLFILYTSGSTGKPKGIQHSIAGYMVYAEYSFRNVFQYKQNDIYWCTADIGWITGHSYIVYGPLLSGATTIMFEGVPSHPNYSRFWEIIETYKVTIFYTAPTAIRTLEAQGDEYVNPYNLSSLRVLGTVGEPINYDAWVWYNEKIGGEKANIVDTWWQTETGGIMISNLAGVTPSKPTYATFPLPGIQPCIMDEKGYEIKSNDTEGSLCIKYPWPSIARSIYNDHDRFKSVYFSTFKNKYFTGDGCIRDEEGRYKITGRVDDILIVSGHNLGTAEIESAIDQHKNVCETAIVGFSHEVKGNGIYAYVICHEKPKDETKLKTEINKIITKYLGPIAKADKIQFVENLPKTRSGKIMRRILRKIANNDDNNLGDISTLVDPSVVKEIKKNVQ